MGRPTATTGDSRGFDMSSMKDIDDYVREAKKQYAENVRNAGGDLSILVKRTAISGGLIFLLGGFLLVWAFAEWFAWNQVGDLPPDASYPTLDDLLAARDERELARGPYRWIGLGLGTVAWFSIAAILDWNLGRYRGRWKHLITWNRTFDHLGEGPQT